LRNGRARRAGHIPWPFTLAVYPGRTLVCDRAQMEAARQAGEVAPPGGTARRSEPA